MPRALLALAALVTLAGCAGGVGSADGAPPSQDDWVELFDGTSLDGWHGYARADVPAAWSVEGGVLTLTPGTDDGGDLVAPGTYGDFELEVEWRIAECGNSGIFYRGEESADLAPIYRTALEMQVLDDCHPDGQYPSHRNGALYDLYTPTEGASRPGDWNTSRIVADGADLEHWLNGEQIVEAEQGSAEWDARLAVSKFRDDGTFPAYGTRRSGIVGIQDHGDRLEVRSVRIRTL
ncbi:3-keto-disaccharide hydrolase [Rubrivirga marina]|uniref:3-keto-alpha-glucoside-1,2-lyase/3-keto-2-hydroxy-glucal hydratase domain-containing protein n=1 Tax=Rubrivirga marina TaxID=1196024 RepID=A0A271IW27_9BACT|nr:DUF1080 domain-containing protein [Rubrivirga marina]PAP75423.1 hypothetical protein BSZ37_02670 [Rubrivirga marina]